MSQRQPSTQTQTGTGHDQRPRSSLEVLDRAVGPSANDRLLEDINAGLGNLDEREVVQQWESFRQAMFADAAFSGPLEARAERVAKRGVAERYWGLANGGEYDDAETRAEFARKYAADLWEDAEALAAVLDLEEEHERDKVDLPGLRAIALQEVAGYDGWEPPQLRMAKIRHETSRSRDGKLLDGVLGRLREHLGKAQQKAAKKLGGDA